MPSDFDFEDVDLEAAPVNAPESGKAPLRKVMESEVAVESASGPRPMATEQEFQVEDEPLDEIEVRMMQAQYYWDIMRMSLFDNPDEVALQVEDEVRQFAKTRLAALMGTQATAPKKRGRPAKAAPAIRSPQVAPRTAPRVVSRPRNAPVAVPSGSKELNEEIAQEIVASDGQKKKKIYKKFVDTESGREYYLGYDVHDNNERVGDGNKYERALGATGGTYFRVISQQALPNGVKINIPLNSQQIEAQSYAHSRATLDSIKKHNSLMDAALNAVLGAK